MTNQSHEPGSSGGSDDAVWEDLVRRLEQEPTATPAHDSLPGPTDEPPTAKGPRPVDASVFKMHPALGGPRDYETAEEIIEDFVPADPPAIGSGNPLLNLAWVAAAGAPLMLLLLAIFWRRAPMPLWIGLCALALAGGAYLFARMPRHRHDNDDGAQV